MIPFNDLVDQYHHIKDEIDEAIHRVLESGHFVLGKEVEQFEQEFASYCDAKYAVGVNTGTSALHLSLLAAGVKPGDEVITTPLTFVATSAAIVYCGATPVFADIDPVTLNLDPNLAEHAITPKTKALLPVHLHGNPVDLDAFTSLTKKHNLILIEDACQAHGATYKGRRVGSFGDAACFSFYPGKNLGAYGEAGIVTTNRPEIAEQVRLLRDWGAAKKYHHDIHAFNFRMESIQAAVLRVKLRHLDKWNEARRRVAELYDHSLTHLTRRSASTSPPSGEVSLLRRNLTSPFHGEVPEHSDGGEVGVHHVYRILIDDRDAVQAKLRERGIETGIHYPIPVHLQKAYANLGYNIGDFPHAEDACNRLLSLPIYPEMREDQVREVIDALK